MSYERALEWARDPQTPSGLLDTALLFYPTLVAVVLDHDPFPTRLRTPVWKRLQSPPWPGRNDPAGYQSWAENLVKADWLTPDRLTRVVGRMRHEVALPAATVPTVAAHKKFRIRHVFQLLDQERTDRALGGASGYQTPVADALAELGPTYRALVDVFEVFHARHPNQYLPSARLGASLEATFATRSLDELRLFPQVAAALPDGVALRTTLDLTRAALADGKRRRRIQLEGP